MTTNQEHSSTTAGTPGLILQIDRGADESPLRFPAVIRNLASGLVTLEVKNPWTILNWESLSGRGGGLRLASPETGDFTELKGAVTRARHLVLDRDNSLLIVNLQLDHADPAAQKLLLGLIPQTTDDLKSLWERWDQARQAAPPAPLISTRAGFAALILMFSAMTLQLTLVKPLRVFGWLLWLAGTVVVAVQSVNFYRSVRSSR